MRIQEERFETHTTLVVRGDIGSEHAETLLEAIDRLIERREVCVAISLRFVKFMNSTALAALVKSRSTLREHGGDLVIVRASAFARETIAQMGLDRLLPMLADEDAAATHFYQAEE